MIAKNELVIMLEGVVSRESISIDIQKLSHYFKSRIESSNLVLVTPSGGEEVQKIMAFTFQRNVPVYTVRDRYCPEEIASREGVLLDLVNLNQVEVDSLNLSAAIGPGVTFPQLLREVKRCDDKLKLAMPAAADSNSVFHNYMRRSVTLISPTLRGRTIIISNYHVVIPGGEVYRSGTHFVSEQDNLPDLPGIPSNVFYGMDDALSVPIKAMIWVFPIQECRRVVAFGFPEVSGVKSFLQVNCRNDRFIEAYAANSRFLSVILAKDGADMDKASKELPPWTVVGSLEGSEELVAVTREVLVESAAKFGGKEMEGDYLGMMSSSLERPWYVWDRDLYKGASCHIPFYTLFRRAEEFDGLFMGSVKEKEYPSEEVGQLLIPLKQGRSVYCEYDLYFEPGDKKCAEIYDYSYEKLVRAGAFVDRPEGKIAQLIYSENPTIWKLQKEIKKKLDPAGVLNPDQLIAKEV